MTSDAEINAVANCLLINCPDVAEKTSGCSEKILRIYQRAIAAASNGIVIVDASQSNLPVIYCNPAFEKTTGYTASEVIGKNCRFLQGKDTDPDAIAQLRQAIHEGQECCVILKNYRKDGQHFWNELTISPVYDADDKITHFIGIQNDITTRKEA
jgi:PAS domain S-box-containing protein